MTATTPLTWVHHLRIARQALRDVLLTYPRGRRLSEARRTALRPLLPYCLHRVGPDSDALVWLNRDYAPLGVVKTSGPLGVPDRVDYAAFQHLHVRPADPVVAAVQQAATRTGTADKGFWLFDDGCAPWNGRAHAEDLLQLIESALAAAGDTGLTPEAEATVDEIIGFIRRQPAYRIARAYLANWLEPEMGHRTEAAGLPVADLVMCARDTCPIRLVISEETWVVALEDQGFRLSGHTGGALKVNVSPAVVRRLYRREIGEPQARRLDLDDPLAGRRVHGLH